MSLLSESLALSTELGMRPLVERVLSRRRTSTHWQRTCPNPLQVFRAEKVICSYRGLLLFRKTIFRRAAARATLTTSQADRWRRRNRPPLVLQSIA